MASMRTLSSLIVLSALTRLPASSQQLCFEASPGFHVDGVVGPPNANLNITGVTGFDDGNGPSLFVSGTNLFSAGTQSTTALAKWNGAAWSDTGVTVPIDAMFVLGGALYVGTSSNPRISTWNGTNLSPLADQPNGSVRSYDLVDLGAGLELIIEGSFTMVGALTVPGIARWNGSTWSAVPNGASVRGPFEAYDDGSGLKLYGISYSGGTCCSCAPAVVRLDGVAWTSLGALTDFTGCTIASDLRSHDDGTGQKLYLAGRFRTVAGVNVWNVARWNGASWSSVRTGVGEGALDQGVSLLTVSDDGSGPSLYAAGNVVGSFPLQTYGILRWDGSSWLPVGGSGLGHGRWFTLSSPTEVQAVGVFDDGSGSDLVAAGTFESAGTAGVFGVARWDGSAWSGFGASGQGTGSIESLRYLDDGTGPALYAGGGFGAAGAVAAGRVARWNGSGWDALGSGMDFSVTGFEVFDDGSGLALYAHGRFTKADGIPTGGMARWDGVQWSAIGPSLSSVVNDLLPHGNLLYAGLNSGGLRAWNGASWSTPGGALNGSVNSLAFYDGYIYATGHFNQAGPVAVNGIARYHEPSNTWSAAGTNIPGGAGASIVYDDGGGSALYVVANADVRRLRAGAWTTLPNPGYSVGKFLAVDFGLGRPSLVALGSETQAEMKVWTGSAWLPLMSDVVDAGVRAIEVVPGSSSCAPEIWVGGSFKSWGGVLSHNVAKLSLCGEPGVGFCFGDGSLATPCPCVPPNTVPNPSGAPGHGCANSFHLDGAKMCAVGTTNPDTVTLRVSGLTPIGFTQFFKGNAQDSAGVAFADGVRCVDGTIFRFGGQNAVLGTAYYPNPALGLVTPISNGGTPPGSGQVGYYQAIYRNATPNFCTIDTLNITNAVQITWN